MLAYVGILCCCISQQGDLATLFIFLAKCQIYKLRCTGFCVHVKAALPNALGWLVVGTDTWLNVSEWDAFLSVKIYSYL